MTNDWKVKSLFMFLSYHKSTNFSLFISFFYKTIENLRISTTIFCNTENLFPLDDIRLWSNLKNLEFSRRIQFKVGQELSLCKLSLESLRISFDTQEFAGIANVLVCLRRSLLELNCQDVMDPNETKSGTLLNEIDKKFFENGETNTSISLQKLEYGCLHIPEGDETVRFLDMFINLNEGRFAPFTLEDSYDFIHEFLRKYENLSSGRSFKLVGSRKIFDSTILEQQLSEIFEPSIFNWDIKFESDDREEPTAITISKGKAYLTIIFIKECLLL